MKAIKALSPSIMRPTMFLGLVVILFFSQTTKVMARAAELQLNLRNAGHFEVFVDGKYFKAKDQIVVKDLRPGMRHLKVIQRRGNGFSQTRTVVLYDGFVNLRRNTRSVVVLHRDGTLRLRENVTIRPSERPGSRHIRA
jgi:hypothetical protein